MNRFSDNPYDSTDYVMAELAPVAKRHRQPINFGRAVAWTIIAAAAWILAEIAYNVTFRA